VYRLELRQHCPFDVRTPGFGPSADGRTQVMASPLLGVTDGDEPSTMVGDVRSRPRGVSVLARFVSEFDRVPLGAAMVEGPDATILHANPRLIEVLGSGRQDAGPAGTSLFDLFAATNDAATVDAFRKTAAGTRGSARDDLLVRSDTGTCLPILVILTTLPAADGEAPRGLCLFIDRTTEKAANLENVDLEQRVAERTADLEAFTYSVSHDLRAPLRAISGFSELLLDEAPTEFPEQHRHYLERISRNARRMGVLIDDLLTFSRLGRQALKLTTVAPRPILDRLLEDLSGELAGRDVEIAVGDLPPCRGDQELVGLVFQNLLTNAVKFSSHQPRARIAVSGIEGPDGVTY